MRTTQPEKKIIFDLIARQLGIRPWLFFDYTENQRKEYFRRNEVCESAGVSPLSDINFGSSIFYFYPIILLSLIFLVLSVNIFETQGIEAVLFLFLFFVCLLMLPIYENWEMFKSKRFIEDSLILKSRELKSIKEKHNSEIESLQNRIRSLKSHIHTNPALSKGAQYINCHRLIKSEKDLQDNLVRFIQNGNFYFNNKKLRIVEGGVEFQSGVGPIDILCLDEDNDIVVIELKRNNNSDKVIGQTMRYVNAIKGRAKENQKVHGLILSDQVTQKMIHSFSSVPNLHLFEWLEFKNSIDIFIQKIDRIQ